HSARRSEAEFYYGRGPPEGRGAMPGDLKVQSRRWRHMLRRVLVGDNERVLLIRKKRFADILAPGEYWIFTLGRNIELERYNIKDPVFASERADYIVREQPELASRYFTVIDTADSQVALVYLDGK